MALHHRSQVKNISIKKKVIMSCIYNRIVFSPLRKNRILPSAATWMDLEVIMLRKQTEKNKYCHLYVESKRYNKLMNITQRKQTHRCKNQTNGYQWREGGGRALRRERVRRFKLLRIK